MLTQKFWAKYFKVYDVLNLLIPYQELLNAVVEELDIKKGEKVLEAGCGTGNLALKIKEKGGEVIGLDNCEEALKVYKRKDSSANTILADLSGKLPFPDNYFDKIASNNTLYTFPKQKQLEILKEFFRILKRGGKVVIANPQKGWSPFKIYVEGIEKNLKQEGFWRTVLKVFKMIVPTAKILYYNAQIKKESNYCFLEPKEQRQLLKEAGFSMVSESKEVYADQAILNSASKLIFTDR